MAPPATTAKTITQRFVYCPNGEDWAKREALRELIRNETVRNAIIFCNRKVEVAILHRSLVKHGLHAGALHGDMDQKSRTETLDKFRAGELMLLAASDVAARGLDIPDVSHIFNFDLPWQSDDYVHRIGRTGRAGKEGNSTSLVTPDELKSLKDIEKMLGEPVVWIGDGPTEQDYARGRQASAAAAAEPRADAGPLPHPVPTARANTGAGTASAAESRARRSGRKARSGVRSVHPRGPKRRSDTIEPRHGASRATSSPGKSSPAKSSRAASTADPSSTRAEKEPRRHGRSTVRNGQPAAKPRPDAARARPQAKVTALQVCRQCPSVPAQARQTPGKGRRRVAPATERLAHCRIRLAAEHAQEHGIAQHEVVVERGRHVHDDERDQHVGQQLVCLLQEP